MVVYDTAPRNDRDAAFQWAASRKAALPPDGKRLYVANSWSDTVSEIDTARLAVVRTLPAGFEPNSVSSPIGPAVSSTSRTASATTSRSWTWLRRGGQTPGGRARRQLPGPLARWRAHLLHPHLSLSRRLSGRAGIGHHRHRHRAPDRSRTATGCTMRPAYSTSPCRPTARLGMAAQLRPKNLIPLAHVEHGWVFGNSLSVFGDGHRRGRAGPDRRAGPLLHAAVRRSRSPRQERRVHLHHGVRQRHGDRYRRAAGVHPRGNTRRAPHPGQRSLGIGQLCGGANPGRDCAQGTRALARRPAPVRREPDGRHDLGRSTPRRARSAPRSRWGLRPH